MKVFLDRVMSDMDKTPPTFKCEIHGVFVSPWTPGPINQGTCLKCWEGGGALGPGGKNHRCKFVGFSL